MPKAKITKILQLQACLYFHKDPNDGHPREKRETTRDEWKWHNERELGITDFNTITNYQKKWLERLKKKMPATESQSCSMNINRRVEDVRGV
jgi:hypothetical protein